MDTLKAAGGVLKKATRSLLNYFDGLMFEKYMGTRTAKRFVTLSGYIIIVGIGIIVGLHLSESETGRKLLHLSDSNTIIIGVSTILLTLFVPIAILLIEDARKSALQRQDITRYIIQFNVTLFVVSLMVVALLAPRGVALTDNYTIKSVAGAVLIACWVYIFHIFINSSRWLTDGSESADGYETPPKSGEPMPEAFRSYRFTQTLRYLANSNSHDAWFHLWKKWYPPVYEYELHMAFFNRQKRILSKRQTRKYPMISLELQAYAKYMQSGKRTINDWRYGTAYLSGFLELHRLYTQERNRIGKEFKNNPSRTSTYSAVVSGSNDVAKITREFIDKNLNKRDVWSTCMAMAEHVEKLELRRTKDGELIADTMVNHFLELLFDHLWNGSIELHDVDDFQLQKPDWAATDENLLKNDNLAAISMVKVLDEWIMKKFEEKSTEHRFGISNVLQFVYPDVSMAAITELYWFRYITRHEADTPTALNKYVQEVPFFYTHEPVVAEFSEPDQADAQLKKAMKEQHERIIKASEIFGKLYRSFFQGGHPLNKLIEESERLAPSLAKQERDHLDKITELLGYIKKLYNREARTKKTQG